MDGQTSRLDVRLNTYYHRPGQHNEFYIANSNDGTLWNDADDSKFQ